MLLKCFAIGVFKKNVPRCFEEKIKSPGSRLVFFIQTNLESQLCSYLVTYCLIQASHPRHSQSYFSVYKQFQLMVREFL